MGVAWVVDTCSRCASNKISVKMQRMSPEEAAKLQGFDLEQEKASARINVLINVAAFVLIVGALRVGQSLPRSLVMYMYVPNKQ